MQAMPFLMRTPNLLMQSCREDVSDHYAKCHMALYKAQMGNRYVLSLSDEQIGYSNMYEAYRATTASRASCLHMYHRWDMKPT